MSLMIRTFTGGPAPPSGASDTHCPRRRQLASQPDTIFCPNCGGASAPAPASAHPAAPARTNSASSTTPPPSAHAPSRPRRARTLRRRAGPPTAARARPLRARPRGPASRPAAGRAARRRGRRGGVTEFCVQRLALPGIVAAAIAGWSPAGVVLVAGLLHRAGHAGRVDPRARSGMTPTLVTEAFRQAVGHAADADGRWSRGCSSRARAASTRCCCSPSRSRAVASPRAGSSPAPRGRRRRRGSAWALLCRGAVRAC